MSTAPEETRPGTSGFLTTAEYFLRARNFAACRVYALRARDSESTNRSSAQILSIAAVISAPDISSTLRDYYSILNLPYFESDAFRIKSNFEALASILHPNVNPYPHASEASVLVSEAWTVLSNPIEKATFDEELKRILSGSGGSGAITTFWTICPYCYYVYEYDTGYEGCSLRCANERCRRVLHASAIGVPPPAVLAKGYYLCPGFMALEVRKSNGEEIGKNSWIPFSARGTADSNGTGLAGLCSGNINGCVDGEREDSASWNSKNPGRGFLSDQISSMYGFGEEGNSTVDAKVGEDSESGVEFFEGVDDLMVGLQCDFDLGSGAFGLW